MSSATHSGSNLKSSPWQLWLEHPEKTRIHRPIFQFHLWAGMLAGAYVFVMSISGSLIVFRKQLETSSNSPMFTVIEWFVRLHENLLAGMIGRAVNGFGGLSLILLSVAGAIVWWPGIMHWRRSLTIQWHASAARIDWDLHNALGFWSLMFVLLWGVSGVYFAFPNAFNAVVDFLEPPGAIARIRPGDLVLLWLSNLHFGRFNLFTEILWSMLGLVPAVLSFTGAFMCCHRIFVRKGGPLDR